MLKKETQNFIIYYEEELQEFEEQSLLIFERQKPLIFGTFGCELAEKITAAFFVNRKSFVEHIKAISNGQTPPAWATGCFYNGQVQTLVDLDNKSQFTSKQPTLTHETVHLYFSKLIYEKFDIERVRWLDESFALYLDGSASNCQTDELLQICRNLKTLGTFDLNVLDDINKVKTKAYNGYDMFLIVGKYIFENNLESGLLSTLITSPDEIRSLGETLLPRAIEHALANLQSK